jgi:hypothetical protein
VKNATRCYNTKLVKISDKHANYCSPEILIKECNKWGVPNKEDIFMEEVQKF